MDSDDLKELKNCLQHDKTIKDKKITKLCEFLPLFKDMQKVQQKISMAMEHMKTLVVDNIEDICGDEDGNVVMSKVVDLVTTKLGAQEGVMSV